jgi:AraC-like DNA-binding protein
MRKLDRFSTSFMYIDHMISDEADVYAHFHKEFEIVYIIEGEGGIRRLNDHEWITRSRSFFLVPSCTFHGWNIPAGRWYHRLAIHFLPEFLSESERALIAPIFALERPYYEDTSSGKADCFAMSLLDCKDMEGRMQKMALKSRLLSLLTEIHIMQQGNIILPDIPRDRRVQAVLYYISNNLQKPVSLDTLSRRFDISKNHLNFLFHQNLGTTVGRYIREQRLNFAQREITAGRSPADVAYDVGFSDYSGFFRAYKAYFGVPPTTQGQSYHRFGNMRGVDRAGAGLFVK